MSEPRCPVCRNKIETDRASNEAWPFCSPRCRDVDLGRWLGESYAIPASEEPGDELDAVPPGHNRDE